MKGICIFCEKNKDLTRHHIIAQNYNGKDDANNLIPNICEECHISLEKNMDFARAKTGAGIELNQSGLIIGKYPIKLITGSIFLDNQSKGMIDVGSPIFGMRMHNQQLGNDVYIEAMISGQTLVCITGSQSPNTWVVFSIARPDKL